MNSELTHQDADRAKELALALPQGENRDAAIDTIALNLISVDPEGTIEWVSSLVDQGLRSENTKPLLQRIRHYTPEHKAAAAELASP